MSAWYDKVSALNPQARQRLARLLGANRPMLVAFTEGGGEDDLKTWIGEMLPRHKVPDRIVALQALPRLPNGKIDRRALLRHLPVATPTRPEAAGGISESAERELLDIWRELLGMDRIEPDDDFFELGGDSLVVIRMVSMARQRGLRIDPADIAENPTIRNLARLSRRDETTVPASQAKDAPLLPIQAWHMERGLPEPEHWNQALRLRLKTPLSEDILRRAFDALAQTHPALGIRLEGERQIAGGSIAIGRRRLSLDGPLVRGEMVGDTLILEAHHLVIDALSWGILLGDLDTLLQAFRAGQGEATLPAALSSLDWAREVARYAASPTARADVALWLSMTPEEEPRDAGTEGEAATLEATLDADVSAALLGPANARFNAEPRDLLIWALAEALAEISGGTRFRIDLEGHGRRPHFSDADLSRTVGWLTEYFPADIALVGSGLERGKEIKEALRRVLSRGAAFGAVRFLGEDRALSEALEARQRTDVLFNYLGQAVDVSYAAFEVVEMLTEDMRAATNSRSHLYEFNLSVREGRIHVSLIHGCARQTAEEAARLLAAFVAQLARVADLCTSAGEVGFTPADFPEADMSQDELDRFLDGL